MLVRLLITITPSTSLSMLSTLALTDCVPVVHMSAPTSKQTWFVLSCPHLPHRYRPRSSLLRLSIAAEIVLVEEEYIDEEEMAVVVLALEDE